MARYSAGVVGRFKGDVHGVQGLEGVAVASVPARKERMRSDLVIEVSRWMVAEAIREGGGPFLIVAAGFLNL